MQCNISPYERKTSLAKKEEDIFPPDFRLDDMSGTPVGSIVSRNLKGRVPYAVTVNNWWPEAIIDKGPKKVRCSAPFLERLKEALQNSRSVSLFLWWSHGYIRSHFITLFKTIIIKARVTNAL